MINKQLTCRVTGNRPQKSPHIKFGDINDVNFMEYFECMYYKVGEKIKQNYTFVFSAALWVLIWILPK